MMAVVKKTIGGLIVAFLLAQTAFAKTPASKQR